MVWHFAVYPTCNWISVRRFATYSLYLDSELLIPLIPELTCIYVSMYVLFLLPPLALGDSQLARLGIRLVLSTGLLGLIFCCPPN